MLTKSGQSNAAVDFERALIEDMAGFSKDPLGWVYYSFPWGEPGPLEKFDGPDDWQIEILRDLRDGLIDISEAIRIAIASGHGIGKSALVAWLILWALSTFEDTKGVVTANTSTQLKTKTWAELTKWYNLFIAKHWFVLESTSIHAADPDHEKMWRVDMIPWSKQNSESFAGLHNQGRRILLVFDEASAIENIIWEVSEGAQTDSDTEIIWIAFGNPTRNTGRFAECFGKHKTRWIHRNIDSRTVRMTNKKQLNEWIDTYGEDSDFVKVRVRGMFPSASSLQLIPLDLVESAFERYARLEVADYHFAARVLGVDPAWYGDDRSAIFLRQGLRAQLLWQGLKVDSVTLAGIVANLEDYHQTDATFIDIGWGAGCIDQLRAIGRSPIGINFGERASDEKRYANKRSEMWCNGKDWLAAGGAICPNDAEGRFVADDLRDDLIGPEYGFTTSAKIQLERKEDMKKRGLASPDLGDALILTFAMPVVPKNRDVLGNLHHKAVVDFDPYA